MFTALSATAKTISIRLMNSVNFGTRPVSRPPRRDCSLPSAWAGTASACRVPASMLMGKAAAPRQPA
jgi:hypothetical protein